MSKQTPQETVVLKPSRADEINNAMVNPDVPKMYANGFSCALGASDIAVLFKIGSQPIAITNLSYTTAKTLSIKLQDLITVLETKSQNTIMTTDDLKGYLSKE
jgi:hypothetical protein